MPKWRRMFEAEDSYLSLLWRLSHIGEGRGVISGEPTVGLILGDYVLVEHWQEIARMPRPSVSMVLVPDASAQFGVKVAGSPAETLTQQASQCRAVCVADFCSNCLYILIGAVEPRLCMFYTQVLKVSERRFAQHSIAAVL
jgi:hypothetical protein